MACTAAPPPRYDRLTLTLEDLWTPSRSSSSCWCDRRHRPAVGVTTYNGFVRLRNLVQEAWRQIDVELKRRHDLIPNLVETVKGYAAHERAVFDEVTPRTAQLPRRPAQGPPGRPPRER